jgi:hypothetical protein
MFSIDKGTPSAATGVAVIRANSWLQRCKSRHGYRQSARLSIYWTDLNDQIDSTPINRDLAAQDRFREKNNVECRKTCR